MREPTVEAHPVVTANMQDPHLQAQAIIEAIMALEGDERTKTIGEVFGLSPEEAKRMAIVRGTDGSLRMELLQPQAAEVLKVMKTQGFETVAFQNRKQRRAAAAQKRHRK